MRCFSICWGYPHGAIEGPLVWGVAHASPLRVAIRNNPAKIAPSTIAPFDTRFDRRYSYINAQDGLKHAIIPEPERDILFREEIEMNTNNSLQKIFFGKFFQVRKYQILPETHTSKYRSTTILLSWDHYEI